LWCLSAQSDSGHSEKEGMDTNMTDTCAKCGRNADGAHFKFYFGKHVDTTESKYGNVTTRTHHYQITGSEQVFLCSTCQIADRRRRAWIFACVWIVIAAVWVGIACLVAIPNPWRDAVGQSVSDPHGIGIFIFIPAVIYLLGIPIVVFVGPTQLVRELSQWNKPYADPQSGVAASKENEQAGSHLAIRLRKRALRQQGNDRFFTPSEYSSLR